MNTVQGMGPDHCAWRFDPVTSTVLGRIWIPPNPLVQLQRIEQRLDEKLSHKKHILRLPIAQQEYSTIAVCEHICSEVEKVSSFRLVLIPYTHAEAH